MTINNEQERLLKQSEVSALTGLGRISIWRLERDGKFPLRRLISAGRVGWFASEIMAWVKQRPAVKQNRNATTEAIIQNEAGSFTSLNEGKE